MFGKLVTDGLEEVTDRVGGFQRLDTDIYPAEIKVAYAGTWNSGAQFISLVADINGREYSEQITITNAKGENFFHPKDKEQKPDLSKKIPLPGFVTIDHLCLVTTGQPLSVQETEEKIVNVWDPELRKEAPKSVPVLVDLIGKKVLLAIVKQTVDQTVKQGNEYVPNGKTKDENVIEKVFEINTKATVVEAQAAAQNGTELKAIFHDTWLEKNKGQTRDKSTKDGGNGRSGRPGASSTPPQSGNAKPAGKSLFG